MAATQDSAVRDEMLSRTTTAGSATATGQALDQASGAEDERLEGADKAESPEGAPEKGDFARVQLAEPSGLQAEPAAFSTAGTIPQGMVASPSGHIPATVTNASPEDVNRTLNSTGRNSDNRKLTEREVESLSGPDLRAIGVQRGYDMPALAGTRTQRRVFLEKQSADSRFKETAKSLKEKITGK